MKRLFGYLLLTGISLHTFSQEYEIAGSASYGITSFLFKDKDEVFANSKTSPVATYGFQSRFQIAPTPSFGIGTGLGYLKMIGNTDPIFIDSHLSNPNATGNFTLAVNSSYLHIPIQFSVILTQKLKMKPRLLAGLNLYVPLNESYVGTIEPETQNPFYSTFQTEITEGKEIRGFFLGSGLLIPMTSKTNLDITLYYRTNNLIYDFENLILVSEQRVLNFKTIELVVGFPVLTGKLKAPDKSKK